MEILSLIKVDVSHPNSRYGGSTAEIYESYWSKAAGVITPFPKQLKQPHFRLKRYVKDLLENREQQSWAETFWEDRLFHPFALVPVAKDFVQGV